MDDCIEELAQVLFYAEQGYVVDNRNPWGEVQEWLKRKYRNMAIAVIKWDMEKREEAARHGNR